MLVTIQQNYAIRIPNSATLGIVLMILEHSEHHFCSQPFDIAVENAERHTHYDSTEQRTWHKDDTVPGFAIKTVSAIAVFL